MHATFKVEAKLQLAIAQPLRSREVVSPCENRIDADPEEDDEDNKSGDELPA
jgi:hypothetical protein